MNSLTIATLVLGMTLTLKVDGAEISQGECSNTDYSKQLGDTRNQGSSDSCYAFVSADLIGFNQNLAKGVRVSALDVNLNALTVDPLKVQDAVDELGDWKTSIWTSRSLVPEMKKSMDAQRGQPLWRRMSDGGAPSITLLSYNAAGGICTERQLPSEGPRAYLDTPHFIYSTVGRFRKNIRPRFDRLSEVRNFCPRFDSSRRLLSASENFEEKAAEKMTSSLRQKCEPRLPLKKFNAQAFRMNRGDSSLTAKIIASILQAGVPVGIEYDNSFLTSGRRSPMKESNHASIISAIRWNSESGRCEFKIRNSWGLSCDPYHAELRKDCDAGNIWVPEQIINERVQTVFAIDPQIDHGQANQ